MRNNPFVWRVLHKCDVDKKQKRLIMDKIARIRQEIERLKGICTAQIKANPGQTFPFVMEMTGYDKLLSFLSTLGSEKPTNPEDAMKELDEKIALVKRRGTWNGVDVDKYIDEVRGRDSEKPMQEGLEEEIERYLHSLGVGYGGWVDGMEDDDLRGIARHFAKWGAEHARKDETPVSDDLEEYASRAGFDYVDNIVQEHPGHRFNDHDVEYAYRDGIIAGAKWDRDQMLKDAVKWLVDDDYDELTDKGGFSLGSVGIGYNGYYIPYSDLLKLPKEDEQ
jgi:hypothetical protein